VVVQLLERAGADSAAAEPIREENIETLTETLACNGAFIGHLHALAFEWQLTERLQARIGTDPVLTPLLQALIASRDAATAALAMRFLASQARFCQTQRRMTLPLSELPGDLLHMALLAMRSVFSQHESGDQDAASREAQIRADYSEDDTRSGMISRLVLSLGSEAMAALSITNAGLAIFLSALSIGSGIDREAATLATNDAQAVRLALLLRAAGLKPNLVAEQVLSFHPDFDVPEGFDQIGPDQAAALLVSGCGIAGA